MLDRTIFSIDNCHDLHQLATFTRYLDSLRAMCKLTANPVQCIGSWKGELEYSWMMPTVDFNEYVKDSPWVQEQEEFLRVPGDQRQPGALHKIPKSDVPNLDGWTYVIETGEYWSKL